MCARRYARTRSRELPFRSGLDHGNGRLNRIRRLASLIVGLARNRHRACRSRPGIEPGDAHQAHRPPDRGLSHESHVRKTAKTSHESHVAQIGSPAIKPNMRSLYINLRKTQNPHVRSPKTTPRCISTGTDIRSAPRHDHASQATGSCRTAAPRPSWPPAWTASRCRRQTRSRCR